MNPEQRLLISGRISEGEISALNREFSTEDFYIQKYTGAAAISGIHDIVSLIFDDFHPLGFARDYLIGKFIDISYSKVKAIVIRLREKRKIVSNISILKEYHKRDGTVVYLNFSSSTDKFEILIKEVSLNLTYEVFEGFAAGKNVSISLDDNNKLRINLF